MTNILPLYIYSLFGSWNEIHVAHVFIPSGYQQLLWATHSGY